jgi:hypothetical protein
MWMLIVLMNKNEHHLFGQLVQVRIFLVYFISKDHTKFSSTILEQKYSSQSLNQILYLNNESSIDLKISILKVDLQ